MNFRSSALQFHWKTTTKTALNGFKACLVQKETMSEVYGKGKLTWSVSLLEFALQQLWHGRAPWTYLGYSELTWDILNLLGELKKDCGDWSSTLNTWIPTAATYIRITIKRHYDVTNEVPKTLHLSWHIWK
jgi:hypothetical protein